jgi:FixJ family two-component response regulator
MFDWYALPCGDGVSGEVELSDIGLQPHIFVIDDDMSTLKALERLLRSTGFQVEVFISPAAFFERMPFDGVGCVLLDLRMPEMSGLDVQEAMRRRGMSLPVVFFSGDSDVRATAQAMRNGAIDFLVKPLNEPELMDAIARAIARADGLRQQRQREHDAAERLARLTMRERQVCNLVAQGFLNKQIGYQLGIGEKTVKVHRGRAMHKLEVDSVAALVRLLSNISVERPSA